MQTVNQARIETSSPNSRRPSGMDERVLPDLKASIRNADSETKQRAKYRKQGMRREDPRRQSRGALRSLWNVLSRNNDILDRPGGLERQEVLEAADGNPGAATAGPSSLEPDLPVSLAVYRLPSYIHK